MHLLPNLPEYDFEVLPGPEQRPALVWTDGASEELAPRPHTIGFVLATPKEGGPPLTEGRPGAEVLAQHYDLVHASAEVPADVIAQLRSRKQQIAAVELFGVLAPYLSVPDMLRGRRVIHWIDNTSAVAASTKGYSKAPDSARIVHALHMRIASIRARVWFEYVRTKANVADEPSRVDLSGTVYELGSSPSETLKERMPTSVPVPCFVPPPVAVGESAAAWAVGMGARETVWFDIDRVG